MNSIDKHFSLTSVIDNYIGHENARRCFKDLELLEFEGKMAEVGQAKMQGVRSDKLAWVSNQDLDREVHAGKNLLFE